MFGKESYLVNESLLSVLEMGQFLARKADAFDLLVDLMAQFEKSFYNKQHITHSARVALLAELMGQALDFSRQETEKLKKAAHLHDVGKLFLPGTLFLSKEKLSFKERQIIRLHPELGFALISHIPKLAPLAPAILFHHEKYNGAGYPYGIRAHYIPLQSRIIGIVDCFEALTSTRPYHSPLTIRQALAEMELQKEQGLWDPYLFEVFVELVSSAEFVDEEESFNNLDIPLKN